MAYLEHLKSKSNCRNWEVRDWIPEGEKVKCLTYFLRSIVSS